jgi:hypothetical protein
LIVKPRTLGIRAARASATAKDIMTVGVLVKGLCRMF